MIKEKFEPVDLTTFTDEEILYLGKNFYKELKAVLDTYRPYFMRHSYYRMLDEGLNTVKYQLKKDESRVE